MYYLTGLPQSAQLRFQAAHLERLNLFAAWQWTRGSPSLPVAQIGGGIDNVNFIELQNTPISGWNIPAGTNNVLGDLGGGKQSSVLAALLVGTGAPTGVYGVCHGSPLIHIKYLSTALDWLTESGDWTSTSQADAATAIRKAFDLGARVIIVPQTWPTDLQAMHDACDYVWANGGIVVTQSGSGMEMFYEHLNLTDPIPVRYPAAYSSVLCVGATEGSDNALAISQEIGMYGYGDKRLFPLWGPRIDVAALGVTQVPYFYTTAPAVQWYSMTPGSTYEKNPNGRAINFGGIQAIQQVGGVLQLILSANPALTNVQAVNILLSTVDKSDGEWMFYNYFTKYLNQTPPAGIPGVGIPDAERAVLLAKSMDPANAGVVFPYLRIHGQRYSSDENFAFSPKPLGCRLYVSSTGTVNIQPDGTAGWEIGGYCNGQPVSTVELWMDGQQVYSGAPTSNWTGLLMREEHRKVLWDLRVIGHASTGQTATRSYQTDLSSPTSASYQTATVVGTAENAADAAMAGDSAADIGPLPTPVIASPANGAGLQDTAGVVLVQIVGAQPGALPAGALIDVWVNGAPAGTVVADVNGVGTFPLAYPYAPDGAQAGDLAADGLRQSEAVAQGAGAGTSSGSSVIDAETPRQGATETDAATAAAPQVFTEAPGQGVGLRDVATGPQLSVEVQKQKATQGDTVADVYTPGGTLAAPTITSPASPYEAGQAPQAAITAAGAPLGIGAVIEFFVNGNIAGIVPADGTGRAQWYLPLPFGSDAAQAGDIASDAAVAVGPQTYVEAVNDPARADAREVDAAAWRENASDGGREQDSSPQSYAEGVVDGAAAGTQSQTNVFTPPPPSGVDSVPVESRLQLPLPSPTLELFRQAVLSAVSLSTTPPTQARMLVRRAYLTDAHVLLEDFLTLPAAYFETPLPLPRRSLEAARQLDTLAPYVPSALRELGACGYTRDYLDALSPYLTDAGFQNRLSGVCGMLVLAALAFP